MKDNIYYKKLMDFISVILSIWIADATVKQISFLSDLNNLWGMILVAGIDFVVINTILERLATKK